MPQFFSISEQAALKKAAYMARDNFVKVHETIYGGTSGRYGIDETDEPFKTMVRYAGLNGIPKVNNRYLPFPELTALKPRDLTVRFDSFRGKYGYLWEDKRDDKFGFFQQVAGTLGEAAAYQIEIGTHEVFNRATDTSFTSGWDNKSLANSAHTNDNGSTYSNQIAAAAPSETLLESILDYFDRVPDAHGRPFSVNRLYFIVHTKKRRAWEQVLNSKTAINVVSGATVSGVQANPNVPSRFVSDHGRITLIDTPYLDSATENAVFVLGEGHELFLLWNLRPKQSMFEEEDPPVAWHTMWFKYTKAWMDARRILVVLPS